MLRRKYLQGLLLLLTGLTAVSNVFADDRRFGSMRSRDYDRGSYYGPRYQPVLPTRPFFVQPYPRNHERHGGQGYRHGYREGYDDGHSDRHARGRRWQGRHDRDHAYGPQGRGYGRGDSHHDRHYYNQPYQQRNYYAPRPGISLYYNNH